MFIDWKFDDANILLYPGAFKLMDDFLEMQEQEYQVSRIVPNQLVLRAETISDSKLREQYLLHKLNDLVKSSEAFFIQDTYQNVASYIE
ncbi:hypothetical protein [Aestuariibaculum marinum]|uniref:Uncharacterized protein n=1 Tax=Aestuariibaculum marinum TaxID=2683592 RepID=A0A8J6U6U1_9FLAO|nr:hypothetical protein [Aestuariibaculum marinum]MBD0824954.1 hypothetical protein [Aestuariibaculum marinum]